MAHYLITLVIETEEGQGSPRKWDWQGLIDSPHGVTVLACTGITSDPTEDELEELGRQVLEVHGAVSAWHDSY